MCDRYITKEFIYKKKLNCQKNHLVFRLSVRCIFLYFLINFLQFNPCFALCVIRVWQWFVPLSRFAAEFGPGRMQRNNCREEERKGIFSVPTKPWPGQNSPVLHLYTSPYALSFQPLSLFLFFSPSFWAVSSSFLFHRAKCCY